jgi:hypothetical protein
MEEKKVVNIEKYVENKLKLKINGKNKMEKVSIGIQTYKSNTLTARSSGRLFSSAELGRYLLKFNISNKITQ